MTSGMKPRKLIQTLCIGAALGTMPLLWGTTLIGVMLAHLFRLNHAALQSVNYLLYQLQLALFITFFKLGEWLFAWGPKIPQQSLSLLINSPAASSLNILGWMVITSLAAWVVTVLPVVLLTYGMLISTVFRKKAKSSDS